MSRGGPAPGGRWDAERFYREHDHYVRGGGRVVDERDVVEREPGFYYEEHDRHEDDFGRRPAPVHEHRFEYERERSSGHPPVMLAAGRPGRGGGGGGSEFGGRGPARVEEDRIHFHHEEEKGPGHHWHRDTIFYEDEPDAAPPRAAVIPYRSGPPRGRRQSIHLERELVAPAASPRVGPPPRPKFIRRQSSLDTHDRRPLPRYGDFEDVGRPVMTIPVPTPRRRRSPIQHYEEREYEEIRVGSPDIHVVDDDYANVRETERTTRSYRFRAHDDLDVRDPPLRRGKTRLPRRLVEKTAIDVLGYPFEEEMDHIVILRALAKEQIDEVVAVSRKIREDRTKYVEVKEVRQDVRLIEAPPPPPIEHVERRTEIIVAPPPPPQPRPVEVVREVIRTEEITPADSHSVSARSSSRRRDSSSHAGRSGRSSHRHHHHRHQRRSSVGASGAVRRRKSRRRRAASATSSSSSSDGTTTTVSEEIITKTVEESGPVHGLFTGFGHSHKDDRTLRTEIRTLEREEKALRLEREAERIRHGADKTVVDIGGGLKVERNKKGKMSLVR